MNCPSYDECMNWAIYQKNISNLSADMFAELNYADPGYDGEISENLECKLEDFSTGLPMIMFYGDPLLGRVNKFVYRGVEAGIYNYWVSRSFHIIKFGLV